MKSMYKKMTFFLILFWNSIVDNLLAFVKFFMSGSMSHSFLALKLTFSKWVSQQNLSNRSEAFTVYWLYAPIFWCVQCPKIFSADIFSLSAWVRNPGVVSFWCVHGLSPYLEWKHHTAFYQIIAHYPHCKLEPVLCPGFLNFLSLVLLNGNMWQIHIQTHSAHTNSCMHTNEVSWLHKQRHKHHASVMSTIFYFSC